MPRQRLTLRVNPTVVAVALMVTAIDAVTKAWARNALVARAVHVGGVLWLRLQYNSGISFSINRSGPLVTTLVTVALALAVVVIGLNARQGLAAAGFGLLIGGGLGNVVDRLAGSPHQVTDFIAVGSFPIFNVADIAITAGFVTLIVATLLGERLLQR